MTPEKRNQIKKRAYSRIVTGDPVRIDDLETLGEVRVGTVRQAIKYGHIKPSVRATGSVDAKESAAWLKLRGIDIEPRFELPSPEAADRHALATLIEHWPVPKRTPITTRELVDIWVRDSRTVTALNTLCSLRMKTSQPLTLGYAFRSMDRKRVVFHGLRIEAIGRAWQLVPTKRERLAVHELDECGV